MLRRRRTAAQGDPGGQASDAERSGVQGLSGARTQATSQGGTR